MGATEEVMRIVPADANLGRTKANLAIGYKILTLNRGLFVPFTTARVIESIPGHYLVDDSQPREDPAA